MANDQTKNAGPVAQEHPYTPAMAPYPPPFGATYPPGYPIYYAQPPDANHGDTANGVPPGPQYMIPFPAAPGMMYPYPPPPPGQGFPQYPQPSPTAANGQRAKRKQVKMACTNCANACKRCDETRPCERCIKYGIQESCVDGVRKERQKGIKRGPYKRKNKNGSGEASFNGFSTTNGDSDWQPNAAPPSSTATQAPPPPIHAVPHYAAPDGYYPYFYPPPPGFIPPGHEGQPAPDGPPGGGNPPPPIVPYYHMPPPGYFSHYPPPGAYPPPPNGAAMSTIDPADASRNTGQPVEAEVPHSAAPATGKKRSRAGRNGERRSKKAKLSSTTNDSTTSGGTEGGSDQASEPGVISPVELDD
ncbi:hypothetical protein HYDPIDRAFT_115073 [Hydnomerulius pinastri MD-312]|uniref:Transcription activator of gluconeogenesis ERT1 n=1 Tax=Hydnomerulius pinastri MD-312 TaxID=994086 RepID=A0A0C9V964_9AGAM|nr:hypothetical protein HYDPIDRAFT_115073 [Hydnomerulius pinastri MD-312]